MPRQLPRAKTAGKRMRALRNELGLTLRDVSLASGDIANKHSNPEMRLSISLLHRIEEGLTPGIYRLYCLAILYGRAMEEVLAWYGVGTNGRKRSAADAH